MRNYAIYNLILLVLLLGVAWGYSNRVDAKQLVYNNCQASRMYNTISEQTCGDLQDEFHMEFLCSERNALASNHCWVEEK